MADTLKLQITYMPIEALRPYERNVKLHPEEQVEKIKASIEAFGMIDPIGIDEKTKVIIEGHGRLEACKQLGHSKVPVIQLGHLTTVQLQQYRLAHNKLTIDSGFDIAGLIAELDDIALNAEIDVTGFDLTQIEEMRARLNQETGEEATDDTPNSPVIQYNIIFDNDDQQQIWFDYLTALRRKYPDIETISGRLIEDIEKRGLAL